MWFRHARGLDRHPRRANAAQAYLDPGNSNYDPYYDFLDLGDFMTLVYNSTSGTIQADAGAVRNNLRNAVIASWASSDVAAHTNGLTAYMPGSNKR